MVRQKLIVTCPACNSDDVAFKERDIILERRCVTDFSLDYRWYTPSVMEKILQCHCNKCGNDFEESLGIQYIPLYPGDIEV